MRKNKLIGVIALVILCSWFFLKRYSPEKIPEHKIEVATMKTVIDSSSDSQLPPAPNTPTLSPDIVEKITVLKEVLTSKNDNDARLDTLFKNMTPELKNALTSEYQNTPKEKLNERGTIVFLLGREAKTSEDLNFLKNVLEEKICLSFQNCQMEEVHVSVDHQHDTTGPVTLAYPQIVSLRMLKRFQDSATGELKEEAYQSLKSGLQSSSDVIRSQTQSMLQGIDK